MFSFFKKIRESNRPRCTALVAAAGNSQRMGGVNKLMELVDGVPVLVRSLTALQLSQRVDEIIVATREEDIVAVSELCRTYGISKCIKVIRGGENRLHSVLLAAMEAPADTDLLAVQDGARPLTTPQLVDAVVAAAEQCGAAAPAILIKDTIKEVDQDGAVMQTLQRSCLRAVQTPQVFAADLLKAALQSALDQQLEITDDCSAVERLGKTVYLIEGEETNLKITTPADLVLAQALLQWQEEQV